MITQLNPPLYVVTPFGAGVAHFLWAPSADVVWYGVFQNATGENWWWQNLYVRLCQNFSDDRANLSPIALPPELEEALAPHKARHAGKKPLESMSAGELYRELEKMRKSPAPERERQSFKSPDGWKTLAFTEDVEELAARVAKIEGFLVL